MLQPQTVLQSRYQIIEQLGQGGMGAVYIAIDQRFGSRVAVKETFFTDGNLRKAFEREAHLLNSLRHPALPRVSDHFAEGDGQFLVMEFIEGEDLGAMLEKKEGAFPAEQVLHWADQILDALAYLHSQTPQVIHRDIKPQNLKLMSNGQIILLDFGLAKGSPSQAVNRVTNTGSIFGYSRHYAPLEQIQGSGTDLRSDIYSLAATLYHLMTGVIPPDALSRATAIINRQPDPLVPANEVNAQVNSSVAKVLYQAMSQTSANRQASASIMQRQLREAATAAITNDKTTKPFAVPQTILDQDTKIMEGQTGNLSDVPFDAEKTMKMTEEDIAKVSASVENITVASHPQIISNPNHSSNKTIVETDSEVTKIATQVSSQTGRKGMSRYIGIAAVVVLLLGASALAYRYALKQRTQTETPVQTQNPAGNQDNANVAIPVADANTNHSNDTQENSSKKEPATQTTNTRKQQTASAENKTSNKNSNTTQSTQANNNGDHSTTGTHDTRTTTTTQQTAPYPDTMTEEERRRRMELKQRQIERRRMERLRRGQIPPTPRKP